VTRVTRLRIDLGVAVAAPRVLLVQGELGTAQLRDLARATPSQALLARAEPAIAWTSPPHGIVVAPQRVLTAGATYTLGVSEPPVALTFTVAPEDVVPILSRVWPDPGAASTTAVWCGREPVAAREGPMVLAPADISGRLVHGTGATIVVPRCLSWGPHSPTSGTELATDSLPAPETPLPAVAPPAIALDEEATALLEPTVLWHRPPAIAPAPLICETNEIPLGVACVAVGDDRVVVRPPDRPVLFTIDDGASPLVRSSRAGKPFVLRPLPADRRFHVATLDETGLRAEHDFTFEPAPARSHVVINEIMANPAGNERTQEWIELYNDGLLTTSLTGYALEAGAARVALPAGSLAPGAFALVVPSGFVADDGVDPVPAAGTLVIAVAALGTGGLANDGERIALRDATGNVISTFPAMKTKNGVSSARLSPDALDLADSFAPSPNGSATPGRANDSP
jgi:hypothetical protein